jgi:hypothetical protein
MPTYYRIAVEGRELHAIIDSLRRTGRNHLADQITPETFKVKKPALVPIKSGWPNVGFFKPEKKSHAQSSPRQNEPRQPKPSRSETLVCQILASVKKQ